MRFEIINVECLREVKYPVRFVTLENGVKASPVFRRKSKLGII
jgi:hypothetical protein